MRKQYDFSQARRGAVVAATGAKTRITIRLVDDVLDWFREQVDEAGGGSDKHPCLKLEVRLRGRFWRRGLTARLARGTLHPSMDLGGRFRVWRSSVAASVGPQALPALSVLLAAFGCSTEFEVDIADLGDVGSVTYNVESRSLSLGMGGTWEHCPSTHAEAEINGVRLEAVDPGSWNEPHYCDDSFTLSDCDTRGFCGAAGFVLPKDATIDTSRLQVRIWDETGSIDFIAIGADGPTGLAMPSWVQPGQDVTITPMPAGVLTAESECSLTYRGNLPNRTPADEDVLLTAVPSNLGDGSLAFSVPTLDYYSEPVADSEGKLTLVCPWPPVVESCTGAGRCSVYRSRGSREDPAAALQVSAQSTPIAAQSDVLNWSTCGLRQGGKQINITGCQSGARDGVLSMNWGNPTYAANFGFEVSYESLASGTVLTAPLIESAGERVVSESCSLTIEQYWVAQDGGRSALQGTARCTPPVVPWYFDPSEFTFRAWGPKL